MVSQAAVPRPLERPRLRRRTEYRLVAGVAGGIADSLNKEAALELGISPKTVEHHVSSVLRKLQLSNRHQLSRWATRRRLAD